MTIVPDSIVVASEEWFNFIVPVTEMLEAFEMKIVPEDFPNESLRGLAIIECGIAARKGSDFVRVKFRHAPNPKSTVLLIKPEVK